MGHSGAQVVYADPELKDKLEALDVEHKFVLGDDDAMFLRDTEPHEWAEPDEAATGTINYTSGTTARPKGVQLTHRNLWLNATVFGLHAGVNDRDVYLHTLPMFHANGWGMPFTMTGLGVPQVVLRKVDGAEILRRVEQHGVTVMCAAPAVAAAVLDAAQDWEGEIPGRDRVRIIMAGAPPPTKTVVRVEEELGWEFVQIYGLTETSPLLTVNRARAEWDDLPAEERAARLVQYHARDGSTPSLENVLDAVLQATWLAPRAQGMAGEVQRTVESVALYHLMALASNEGAPMRVRAAAWKALEQVSRSVAPGDSMRMYGVELIKRFREDPKTIPMPAPLEPPPGQPI